MSAKQTYTPQQVAISGVMYGFDPSDTNKINAVKVDANGAIATTGGGSGGSSGGLTNTELRAAPVNVTQAGIIFTNSALNNSNTQLSPGQSFVGGWENIFNQPAIQVLGDSDQSMKYVVEQSIDSAGTDIVSSITFIRSKNEDLCENVQLNGNYVRITATNIGNALTTTFELNCTLGPLTPMPQALSNYGNLKVSGRETQNFNRKLRDAMETYPNPNWTNTSKASGDLIMLDGNAAGASYLALSLNPLVAGTESFIESDAVFKMPLDIGVGLHASQRTVGQEMHVQVLNSSNGVDPAPYTELTISSIQQATTTLTITTSTNHNLKVGMRIGIYGVTQDSRLNYASLVVATTPTLTQFTATAGPMGNIQSLTVGPFTSGYVYIRDALSAYTNGTSMILENAIATNASFYVKSEGGDSTPIYGVINASHATSIATTYSTLPVATTGNYVARPSSQFLLSLQADKVQWSDIPIDTLSAQTNRATFAQIVPSPDQLYKIRFKIVNRKGFAIPNAKIVSVSKTGTTTATVVTDVPHGYTTGDYITTYGVRDQTNFANITTATVVASVVNSTTFTIVWGAAVTATSYGGLVSRAQGGQTIQGVVAHSAQSVTIANSLMTVVGSAAWSGISIGDLVNFYGCRESTAGTDVGVDGVFRVRDFASTNLVLEAVGSTTIPTTLALTNCGGTIIRRTDMRISFVRVFDYERLRVESLARPSGDIASAFPVTINNTPAVTVSSISGGSVAEDAAAGTNPLLVGGVVRTAVAPTTLVAGDAARSTYLPSGTQTIAPGAPWVVAEVASAARTTTGNSGTISTPAAGNISGLINVTAVSGTSPTLDLTLEESLDNGTTWRTAWAAPRLTGTGTIEIPAMRTSGIRRWAWAITGTTPSFTFAITTNSFATHAPTVRSLIDRSITPNTLGSVSAALNVEGCSMFSILAVSGAGATTSPVFGLQISEDGTNWAAVSGISVTVPASSNVFAAINGVTAKFARLVITTAGVAATHTYAVLRALSN